MVLPGRFCRLAYHRSYNGDQGRKCPQIDSSSSDNQCCWEYLHLCLDISVSLPKCKSHDSDALWRTKSNAEFRNCTLPDPKPFLFRFAATIILHISVYAAIGLIVLGFQPHQNHGEALQQAGYAIFVISLVIVAIMVALSWKHRGSSLERKMVSPPLFPVLFT